MSKITAYTAISAPLTDCVVPIVDIHDTTQAASGTTKKVTLANILEAVDNDTDTNIKQDGAQASGVIGSSADAGHVHPAISWIPSDNGMLAVNFPAWAGSGVQITTAGNLYLLKIWIRQPFTATNLLLSCTTAGAGASTTSFCGLWSSAGTLLTGSADIASGFTSTGLKTLPFTTPQALTVAMGFVWAGFVFNMATTQPQIRSAPGPGVSIVGANLNLSAAQFAAAVNGTTVTSLASITPSSNSQGGTANLFWCGIT